MSGSNAHSPARGLPLVAIVGRPNVGKSSLFNRYAGGRRALVEDTPGWTRDRIVAEVEVGPRRILLVDTAGFDPDAEAGLPAAVQAQAQAAVDEADAVLFVVDGKSGLLPEDERIAQELRRTDKPVALAVNKVDHPRHADRVDEFHRLSMAPMAGVSASHGSGAWDLLETLVAALPEPGASADEDEHVVRLAIVGRPNVGKSSLVNRLVGDERVVVSEQPGTTRDAIDIRIEDEEGALVIVDTAGLRRPGRRAAAREQGSALMAVRAIERADVALVLVDASEGFTDQDARVAGLVRERGCAAALLVNKWDLVKDLEDRKRVHDEVGRRMRFMSDTPVLNISARTGSHVDRIVPLARRLAARARRKIPTHELNRWLEDAVRRHEPAMAQKGTRRRPLKFFYATQTDVAPPTFVLFCTAPQLVQPSYVRFLENRLREAFDLDGVPLRLRLKARRPD